MTMPAVRVEVSFNAPTDPEVWTQLGEVRSSDGTRGRQSGLDHFDSGKRTWVVGDVDRLLDPENTASPYYPHVKSNRRIREVHTYLGVDHVRFYGYIDGLPRRWQQPNDAYVTITATDGFKLLERARLLSSIKHEYLLDSPVAAYMLDDQQGSTSAVELTGAYPAAPVVYGKGPTSGTFAFGDNALPGDDEHTTLTLTPHILTSFTTISDGGYVVKPRDAGVGPVLSVAGGVTVECAFRTSETRFDQALWGQWDRFGRRQFYLLLGALGQLYFYWGEGYSGFTLVTTTLGNPSYADGQWHHVAATLGTDGKSGKVYVDGGLVASGTGSTAATVNTADTYGSQIGAVVLPTNFGAYLNGQVATLGLYQAPLSAARIAQHADAVLTGFAGELSGTRVNRLLDYAGWPAALRDVDPGVSTLAKQTLKTTALSALHQVEDSEAGALFMAADGPVRFRDRYAPLTQAVHTTVQATFGDNFLSDPSELPYSPDLTLGYDEQQVRNSIEVNRVGGVVQPARDEASIDDLGEMAYTPGGDLLNETDDETYQHAHWLLAQFKGFTGRIETLTVNPGRRPAALLPVLLALDIGHRVRVLRTEPGGGARSEKVALVESVRDVIRPGMWESTSYALSAADTKTYLMWTAGSEESTAAWAY
jgi:hypothetical protein